MYTLPPYTTLKRDRIRHTCYQHSISLALKC